MLVTVYLITNEVNGKRYVGVTTKTLKRRWKAHRNAAVSGSYYWLHKAMRKYGNDAFVMEELAVAWCRDLAAQIEERLIAFFGTYWLDGRGYNQTRGGDGHKKECTPETRLRLSAAMKNKFTSEEMSQKARGNTNLRGRARTEEATRKQSLGMTRYPLTYKGETLTMWEWSNRTGIKPTTIRGRLKAGWTPEEALMTPVARVKRKASGLAILTCKGESLSISEWSERTGIRRGTIVSRLRLGWSPEMALTPVTEGS